MTRVPARHLFKSTVHTDSHLSSPITNTPPAFWRKTGNTTDWDEEDRTAAGQRGLTLENPVNESDIALTHTHTQRLILYTTATSNLSYQGANYLRLFLQVSEFN